MDHHQSAFSAAGLVRPVQTQLFIGGRFVDAVDGGLIDVINPCNGQTLCQIAEAREADVDIAVEAAKAAFPAWSRMDPSDRGQLLLRLADAIEAEIDEFVLLEALDTGHPVRDVRKLDVPRTARCYRYFGGMADKYEGTMPPVYPGFVNYVQREPLGVVGQIIPWNFPLMFTAWKMAPALAAGNTIVIKPSEITPLSILRVVELMKEVGIPDGVVNVVPGYGHTAGKRLSEHPDVKKIAFTGSTATGRRIVEASAGNLKKVQLELGGKGPNIIFDDAVIPAAVGGSAWAIFHNQGQACIAGSRIIIHEKIVDQFLDKFVALAKSIRLGDPLDPETEMGPVTSKLHQRRVLDYVQIALEEGGELVTGGKAPEGAGLDGGYFIEPTIVRAKPEHRVCQEEVFGPFVTVSTFSDDDEALAIANSVAYGLGSGVWTQNLSRAHRFARDMNAGMVWINSYKVVHPGSPFGGVGESGYGREMGFEVMHEYTQPKSVWVNVDAPVVPHYVR